MPLNWLLHPVAAMGLAALGTMLCLLLFLSLKRDLRRSARAQERAGEESAELLASLRSNLASLEERVRRLEETAERVANLPLAGSGINLNKRSQALRMHRRGEPSSRIAAALGLPEGEVELLLKIHQLAAEQGGEPSRQRPSQT